MFRVCFVLFDGVTIIVFDDISIYLQTEQKN